MKPTYIILGLLALFLLLGGCLSMGPLQKDTSTSRNELYVQGGGSYAPPSAMPYPSLPDYSAGMMDSGRSIDMGYPQSPSLEGETYQTKEANVRIEVAGGSLESSLARAKGVLASKNAQTVSVSYDEYYGTQRYILTFKVLPGSLDATIGELGALGNVTSLNVQVQDVTRQYVDLDIRLKNSKLELERLYKLYNQTESVEELLGVEKEISRLTSDIEILTSQKNDLEGRISQSTVILELYSYVGVPESQEAQLSLKVPEGTIEARLTALKSVVSSNNGEITSLQFVDSSDSKSYDLSIRVPSANLASALEGLKGLGETKYFVTTINEQNRPKVSLVLVKVVEEKPIVQRNLFVPLDNLGELFFGAFSIGVMAIVGFLGLIIPLGVIVVIAKKAYSFVGKKDTNVPSNQERSRK